ncbi:MAG: dienelactone hydrolase family protein [Phaeodactylibacter sp.]|nr:dienelactone hydrolase family protein [Phaeodactylibacter sp.]MCB9273285.1 dienelactone hydrolase family protein [Lewinellaceae bacterium]
MHLHTITVPRTARYCTLGQAGPHVRYLWIACHGYGQLARDFIQTFEAIAADDTLIVAPEGLSRFYWTGFSGNPVASWMTREGREEEISDYTNFLSILYNRYVALCSPDVRIMLMGFSQGCATQMRWIMRAFPRFHRLILWAGAIPEDLHYLPQAGYFSDKALHFVYGTQDPFFNQERLQEQQQLISDNNLAFRIHTFEGRHVVDESVLREIAAEMG